MAQIATMDGRDRDTMSWRDKAGIALIGLGIMTTVFWCGLIAAAMAGLVIHVAG